ncbi:hypothetical protein [Dactylosporangium sp. NPDC048998]|uniref:hypothetical protein n=1 Tax=Dactylosporangium sp. NPDC048998 TaxID=3363976 RepID=UPI00371D094E
MTLNRKGSRRIVVDGVEYRWTVRHRPTYSQANGWTPLTFVVQADSGRGAVLVVSSALAHPHNWLGLSAGAVRPALVAEAVRRAVAAGWRPEQAGAAFALPGAA